MRALLLVVACGGTMDIKPDQPEAEAVVWHGLWGMTDAPPPVRWFPGSDRIPNAFGCSGRTYEPFEVQVACGPDCSTPIRVTSWAHEALHWRCWLTTGDVDGLHSHCNWNDVDAAARAMVDAGMH